MLFVGPETVVLVGSCLKNGGILLANLFQRFQADVSTRNFPSSYEFEEAVR